MEDWEQVKNIHKHCDELNILRNDPHNDDESDYTAEERVRILINKLHRAMEVKKGLLLIRGSEK